MYSVVLTFNIEISLEYYDIPVILYAICR